MSIYISKYFYEDEERTMINFSLQEKSLDVNFISIEKPCTGIYPIFIFKDGTLNLFILTEGTLNFLFWRKGIINIEHSNAKPTGNLWKSKPGPQGPPKQRLRSKPGKCQDPKCCLWRSKTTGRLQMGYTTWERKLVIERTI